MSENPVSKHRPAGMPHDRAGGFTLIELMIALAVLAVLLAIGVPSFQDMIQRNRISAASNDALGGMSFAKHEAIRRNASVRFCINLGSGAWVVENSSANVVGAGIRSGSLHPSVGLASAGLDTGTVAGHACVRFRPDGTASPTGTLTLSLGALSRVVNVQVGVLNAN